MKKKKSSWIMPMLLGCLTFFAVQSCKKDDVTKNTKDSIKILTISPTSGFTDGQVVNFVVTVSYNLASKQTGTLMMGFNNGGSVASSVIIADSKKVINSGSGKYTFNVSATAKNWGSQGDFTAYVNLSENPIPTPSWTPLANDWYILKF